MQKLQLTESQDFCQTFPSAPRLSRVLQQMIRSMRSVKRGSALLMLLDKLRRIRLCLLGLPNQGKTMNVEEQAGGLKVLEIFALPKDRLSPVVMFICSACARHDC